MRRLKQVPGGEVLCGLILAGAAQLALAQGQTVTYEFSQTGFSTGGSVSGFFRGTDLDGDGRIYAVSRAISDIFGLPFGNELDYAEVTFTGFGDTPGARTVVYDKSAADMESPRNFFMAFAYNLDGGPIGDQPNEGVSLSVFSPSTNYNMGEAFSFVFANESSSQIGSCGVAASCGLVISLVPDDTTEIGARVTFEDFSGEPVVGSERIGAVRQVPLSPQLSMLISLALAALGGLLLHSRRLSNA